MKINKGLTGVVVLSILLFFNPHWGYSQDVDFSALEEGRYGEYANLNSEEREGWISRQGTRFGNRLASIDPIETTGAVAFSSGAVASKIIFGYSDPITIIGFGLTINHLSSFSVFDTNSRWKNALQAGTLGVASLGLAITENHLVEAGVIPYTTAYAVAMLGVGAIKAGHVFTRREESGKPKSQGEEWDPEDIHRRRSWGLRGPKKLMARRETFAPRDREETNEATILALAKSQNLTYIPQWAVGHTADQETCGTGYDGVENPDGFLKILAFGKKRIIPEETNLKRWFDTDAPRLKNCTEITAHPGRNIHKFDTLRDYLSPHSSPAGSNSDSGTHSPGSSGCLEDDHTLDLPLLTDKDDQDL